MSSTSLILVRDTSPLRCVFVDNALRRGLHTDLTNPCFVVQAASFVQAWRCGSIPIWRLLNIERFRFVIFNLFGGCGVTGLHSVQPMGNAAPPSKMLLYWTAAAALDQWLGLSVDSLEHGTHSTLCVLVFYRLVHHPRARPTVSLRRIALGRLYATTAGDYSTTCCQAYFGARRKSDTDLAWIMTGY